MVSYPAWGVRLSEDPNVQWEHREILAGTGMEYG